MACECGFAHTCTHAVTHTSYTVLEHVDTYPVLQGALVFIAQPMSIKHLVACTVRVFHVVKDMC